MIEITPSLSINESELQFDFVRASGPGGQNVNKVSTAVQLRFDLAHSVSLPEDVKARLAKLAGRRLTADGELQLIARRYRTQEQNRADALGRLVTLVQKAAEAPRPRRRTRPTQASQEERLKAKKQRGEVKRGRQNRLLDP